MEIPVKLLEYKLQILSFFGFVLAILSFFYLAPNLIRILNYFSPLLVSTALFLVAIVVIGRISPLVTEDSVEKTGEGLLAYVASEPEHLQQLLAEDGGGGETVTAH
ncbi:hypothetical protein SASPL_132847 [Salvia splendens]|uniref:Uncharacterized protein n=1 Tax=Salvia splendens TaxID=180675 RepID=A0A8X8X3S5_SALSN|nr:hypothetical protein SASPL_132847 [Salvia splendens]